MIEILNGLASFWWIWMSQNTVQVAILIVLAYLFELATRRWVWPQFRLVLWLLVLTRLLLPPSLSSPLSVTAPLYSEASQLLARVLAKPTESRQSPGTRATKPEFVQLDTRSGDAHTEDAGPNATPGWSLPPLARASEALRPIPRLTWQAWLLLLWAAVSSVLLSMVTLSSVRLRRRLVSRSENSELVDVASEVARRAGLKSPPQIRISRSVATPAVVGLWKPVVLLPHHYASIFEADDLQNALLHEMCHIKRRDLLTQRVVLLLHALYWFNPLLWPVRRRLRHLTELGCDARVVRLLHGESKGYRATILRALRPLLGGPVPRALDRLGLLEHPGRLNDRLNWLSRAAGSRLRIPVVAAVSMLVMALVLPMVSSRRDVPSDFTILRLTTFTPIGTGQSYLEGLDLFVVRNAERQGLVFDAEFSDPEHPRQMKIYAAQTWAFEESPDCAVAGNRLVREDEILGQRTLVYQIGSAVPLGVTEVSLAPEFHCIPLRTLSIWQNGTIETKAIVIRTGADAVASLGLPEPPEQTLEKRSQKWQKYPPPDVRTAYPGVRALMADEIERFGDIPLVSDYERSVRKTARSVVWDETGSGITSRAFGYPFDYEETAVIGPHDAYYLTRPGVGEIHRCDADGRIVEDYSVGIETLPATHRPFTVDSQGRLLALLQVRNPPEPAYRADAVRIFEAPESKTDVSLSRPAFFPIDFSIDASGRYYILRWDASAADLRLVGEKVVPPASHSLSVDRYSPGGELEQSLSLDPFLYPSPAAGTWNWSRPASLAVLADGRTFVLLLSNRTQGQARITLGRPYEVDWQNSSLRPIPVEPPSTGLVTLTDIHALEDALILEWSDYASIPDGQLPVPMFAVKKLQLWHDGEIEPLVNIRGVIEAVSENQALVTRTEGRTDAPVLFLVTFR